MMTKPNDGGPVYSGVRAHNTFLDDEHAGSAGWQAMKETLKTVDAEELVKIQAAEIARLTAALAEAEKRGYDMAKDQAASVCLKGITRNTVYEKSRRDAASAIRAMVKP